MCQFVSASTSRRMATSQKYSRLSIIQHYRTKGSSDIPKGQITEMH